MNKEKSSEVDWAEIVDIFASEYGWTMDYIFSLTLPQIAVLMDKMKERKNKQESSEGGTAPTTGAVSSNDEEVPLSYFENSMGGKKVVENGITKIII